MKTAKEIRTALVNTKPRSAWNQGVKAYAFDLLDEYEERMIYEKREAYNILEFKSWCLNGARDWKMYSEGGCSLIYDTNIAKRLCNATELKKTDSGHKAPNNRESWIDVQSRALYQAFELLADIILHTAV